MDIIFATLTVSIVLSAVLAVAALMEEARRRTLARHRPSRELDSQTLEQNRIDPNLEAVRGRSIRTLSGEVARFSAVNLVATVFALLLFNGLVHGITGWFHGSMFREPIVAYVIANGVGMFIAYYGARYYAFRHQPAPSGGLLNYVLINLSSFAIPAACLMLSRHVVGWDNVYADNISANVIGAILGNAFRFLAFRRFVFVVRSPVKVEHTMEHAYWPAFERRELVS